MGYGFEYYISNQNAYDANRTYYTENYYDYIKQKFTPSSACIWVLRMIRW